METIVKISVNLHRLKPDGWELIVDRGLQTLYNLPNLTHLDITPENYAPVGMKDVGLGSSGILKALREISISYCMELTDYVMGESTQLT